MSKERTPEDLLRSAHFLASICGEGFWLTEWGSGNRLIEVTLMPWKDLLQGVDQIHDKR